MIKWVVQNNLINKIDHDRIVDICKKYKYQYESIDVIPFSKELPNINNECLTIFYGGTKFIENIYNSKRWNPATFFNPDTFNMKSCVDNYKEYMINYPCTFTTIKDFASSHRNIDDLFFIRPIKDLKEFSGEVMDFNKLLKWEQRLRYLPGCDNNPDLTIDTEIMVSEAIGIAHEWRFFVVNKKVISGSHYRSYNRLEIKEGYPNEAKEFVEKLCNIWTPSDVFVIDIGMSDNNFYVIECNCFNSSGFYKSDLEKIIVGISNFIGDKYEKNS